MLVLSPSTVTFAGVLWPGVTAVSISRSAVRRAVEWSDAGPHPTFADVPEQLTTLEIRQDLRQTDLAPPALGASGTLDVRTSATGADGRAARLSAEVVIVSVSTLLGPRPERRVELVAVSADGASDPIALAQP